MSTNKDSRNEDPPLDTSATSPFIEDTSATPKLSSTLKPRHLSMIALGGVIGAGLLVASSGAILAAGPAVIITYAIAGLIVILVMRMLGEMASVSPDTGSFSTYATKFIGPWAGLSIGWMYWWFWVVVVGIEATAAATIIVKYLPGVPQWIPALVLTLLFLGINLISVKSFGEIEFWFSSVKIVAIVAFIFICLLGFFGAVNPPSPGFGNLVNHGGFAPFGVSGILAALLPVCFSMFGAEVATIAAGESEDPKHAVRKAVNSVVWRIMIFYLGSISVILLLMPWNKQISGVSPFTATLEHMGIGWASVAMDAVIFAALLSTLNAALYTASRMVFSLAARGEAPKSFMKVNARRFTPYVAVLVSASVGLASVILNYTVPEYVFAFLVNSTGATAIFVWLVIAVSQLRSRKLYESKNGAKGQQGEIKMWGFPYITWIVIVALASLLLFMTFNENPQTRLELYLTLAVVSVSVIAGVIVQRKQKKASTTESAQG